MATKPKRVTYNDPVDDNADYLVPLQDDPHSVVPPRLKSSKKPAPSPGKFGSINFLITILLYAGVPISQFVIGLIYINRCTIQQFISTYMILSGLFGIAFVIVSLIIYKKVNEQTSSSYDNSRGKPMSLKILIPIFVLLLLFVIAWFFAGQVVVFQVKTRVEFFDSTLPEYCHGNLYKAAYILIFVDYLIFLIAIILYILSGMSSPDEAKKTKRPTRNPRK
jgi:uncharacterized membrane protein